MKDQINTIREALEFIDGLKTGGLIQGRTREALTALTQLESMVGEQEFALPETPFQEVAPGIEVGYDFFGGVDIRLGGEFVYVHINYDHRYTHNSARAHLADQIVGLLTGKSAAPVAQQPQAEPDMRKVCEALGFDPTNHHNAAKCPYCRGQQPQAEAVPDDVGQLEYRGNSVAYIHQKMTAYRGAIDAAWQAMRDAGRPPDGCTPLAQAITKALAPQQAEAAPVAVVKYQVGGLVVHIVGDVQEGDELFKTPQQAEAVPSDVVRDSERMKWIIDNARITSEHWGGRWSIVLESKAPDSLELFSVNPQAAVRRAIDAAIAQQKGGV